jgi:hypothetical protein
VRSFFVRAARAPRRVDRPARETWEQAIRRATREIEEVSAKIAVDTERLKDA